MINRLISNIRRPSQDVIDRQDALTTSKFNSLPDVELNASINSDIQILRAISQVSRHR